jgi:pyruvate/2-oxoglutarate dehydrogenase complex dihydrolipoamide dehydrogenase (E3) component
VRAALSWRDYMTSSWDDKGQLPWLEERHIELVRGFGRLTGERTVTVDLREGGTRDLTARKAVVVATGSSARIPPVPELVEGRPWTNRDVTAAKEVPRRFAVLGGGPVGVEMAQAFRRLGSDEVTVIHNSERLLPREEPFAGNELRAAFEADGIRVITDAAVTEVRRNGTDGPFTITLGDGTTIESDEFLVATGRQPRTEDIGLDVVGLPAGKSIEVDDQMRAKGVSGNWLYAVGDVNGLALLTHVGKYQARLVGDVIAGRDVHDLVSKDIVPRVTFTDPQVCAVGLTEQQARERYDNIKTVSYGTGSVSGAYTSGKDVNGTSYLVIDDSRRVIVGATFTGPDVDNLLHSATIAIVGKVPLDQLWHAVPSFPTISEVWLRLLETYGL